MDGHRDLVAQLAEEADRLDELADVAELMDDIEGAARFRRASSMARDRAMAVLDVTPAPEGG